MRKDLIEDWNKVNSYDVSEMARLFAHKQSIPYSYSLDAFEEVKKYLFVTKYRSPNTKIGLAANIVDWAWHFWMICTSEYRDFCENYICKECNHNPTRYWAETIDEEKTYPGPMHENAMVEYEKIFGYKAPAYLWTGIRQDLLSDNDMPGAVSWHSEVYTPGSWKRIDQIRIGDEVISARGEVTKVKYISCWGSTSREKYMKFENYSWFVTDNAPFLVPKTWDGGTDSIICANINRYKAALKTPVHLSVSDKESAILEMDIETAEEQARKFVGYGQRGINDHFPQPGTEMYTLYTEEDGFKIRGGWNVMSPQI
jgi:hypothetical protein